ncbi:hypothetical protein SASPL_130286 [Salvia splendens]|uniref:Uncharacterized protein n=1 Tax=Salvia splendens TaxID=180675 RepID=A0A8X8X6Y9_SALSN|nr:hypothetical protein SASPL_130286 [Salvia splendens]
MVQTLEAIRGGGGSVKVGTTGKISALMSREIESASKAPSPSTSVSVSASDVAPRKLNSRTSTDEASSSAAVNTKNSKCPEPVRKTKHHRTGRTHYIPMLAADNMSLDGTPTPVSKSGRSCFRVFAFRYFHHRTHARYELFSGTLVIADSRLDPDNWLPSWCRGLLWPNWRRLKYSISRMMSDPTVPLVPITTG